ncbi:maleylpyruvate isomerase family mycothiol-dependent enzyme [Streptomyces sp. NPDC059477]|uniref:maleylpyruvate isomerase family mycothiol-dependent enzyme n=1 Tax=Streptomyces sp. NPDC059477 TaxID=3346847 RepID=UPI0036AE2EB1
MDTAHFLDTLDAEGRLLATAAERAGTDAAVPTCPDWRVGDLLRHTGTVHRWAAGFIADGIQAPRRLDPLPALDGPELVAWYRDSHRELVLALTRAAPDTECWAFLPAPSPLAFWRRRQAHETTVHRFDAEAALAATRGGTPPPTPTEDRIGTPPPARTTTRPAAPSPIAPDFAVDGIDELLRGFHARARSRVRTEKPRVLRVRTSDADAVWTVRLSQEPPAVTRGAAENAECELSGPADLLYLALWNRVPVPQVSGDPSLARLWRQTSAV